MPFSAEWLALREPADRAARSATLVSELTAHLPTTGPLEILDLACGTGANLRALADLLPGPQRWLLVDNDGTLLDAARALTHEAAVSTAAAQRATHTIDLRAVDLRDLAGLDVFRGRALVTASALLDLVSDTWLNNLVTCCREHEAAVLFALIYDGQMTWDPAEPEDELVRELVNRHQRRDKGFGPAAGPGATDITERLLRSAGYAVRRERSDWVLNERFAALQEALMAGLADAAIATSPEHARAIRDWHARRLAHIAQSDLSIVVGHQDLAAWLDL